MARSQTGYNSARMEIVTRFFQNVLNQFGEADFALLAIIDFSAFGLVCVAAFFGCAFSRRLRSRDKRVFLCMVNAFTALTLAVFLTEFSVALSVAFSAFFWCAGYIIYGALSLFKAKVQERADERAVPYVTVSSVPPAQARPPKPVQNAQSPSAVNAVNSGVRLEHAISISDKLLLKNLGRGDRQELEKIKTALTVLKVKGVLSAQEGEALNDMFNALLKLMAKYDL